MNIFKKLFFANTIIACVWITGCNESESITTINVTNLRDTLYVIDFQTNEVISAIPPRSEDFTLDIGEATYVRLSTDKDERDGPSAFIEKGDNLNVTKIREDQIIVTGDKDSELIRFLKTSNNIFVQKSKIFGDVSAGEVKSKFMEFMAERQKYLEGQKDSISNTAYEFLTQQNEDRVIAFLNFYGRTHKNLEPESDFYDFNSMVDVDDPKHKNLPLNVLMKIDNQYRIEKDSITDLTDFFVYLGQQFEDQDLAAYYQARYIHDLLSNMRSWPHHEPHFNAETLEQLKNSFEKQQASEKYRKIFRDSEELFQRRQQGIAAVDFEAYSIDGETLTLDSLHGKVVLIDVWATWCAPCIKQRPGMLETIEHYKNNDDFLGIMLSIDEKETKWQDFITEEKDFLSNNYITHPDFLLRYSKEALPAYILFNKEGRIANLDAPKPGSQELYAAIDNELQK